MTFIFISTVSTDFTYWRHITWHNLSAPWSKRATPSSRLPGVRMDGSRWTCNHVFAISAGIEVNVRVLMTPYLMLKHFTFEFRSNATIITSHNVIVRVNQSSQSCTMHLQSPWEIWTVPPAAWGQPVFHSCLMPWCAPQRPYRQRICVNNGVWEIIVYNHMIPESSGTNSKRFKNAMTSNQSAANTINFNQTGSAQRPFVREAWQRRRQTHPHCVGAEGGISKERTAVLVTYTITRAIVLPEKRIVDVTYETDKIPGVKWNECTWEHCMTPRMPSHSTWLSSTDTRKNACHARPNFWICTNWAIKQKYWRVSTMTVEPGHRRRCGEHWDTMTSHLLRPAPKTNSAQIAQRAVLQRKAV